MFKSTLLSRYQCSDTLAVSCIHNMMTSSNGNIFRVTGPLCGEFTGHRWIPLTKASDAELWCFLWSAPEWTVEQIKWVWWFETPSRSLWRHCNDNIERHRAHTVVSWPTLQKWLMIPISDLMMTIKWSTNISKSLKDKWVNWKHTAPCIA